MIVQSLLAEFLHEAESTRKLLKSIPDSALGYKPAEISWTMGQLASHIAGIYDWYRPTLHQDVFDMSTYKYEREDTSVAANIVARFEENVMKAQNALETATDESMFTNWRMTMGGDEPIMPVMPRMQVVRGFLFNHLYHHRGEMIVYLRATGNRVPSIYGPTAEESN